MKESEFKYEIKVKILGSYTKRKAFVGAVGILIGPPLDAIDERWASVQNNDFPHLIDEKETCRWQIHKKWVDKRHCRIPIQHLKVVGDERICVGCLKSKVRQPTPCEVPLDHKCWSCLRVEQ